MRESFILTSKNNGYPSFSNSTDINSDFCQNQSMFITNGKNYPIFKNKNYCESSEIINMEFHANGINYPQLKNVGFSLISGAFADCTNLRKIIIPKSVKFIGENSFRNTKLSSVKISSECIYSKGSFPNSCKIIFY